MSDDLGIDLPHGAWFDDETGTVSISLGRVTLSFSLVEFYSFHDEMSDIIQVLDQMVDVVEEFCEDCGTRVIRYEVNPPGEDDFN